MTLESKATIPRRINWVTAFVLAGGASRRMGRPKAQLALEGETMLERQVRLCRAVARNVIVVGWPLNLCRSEFPKALRRISLLPDEIPGQGPLGGICTGLKQTTTEYNLFLSCDMPLVSAEFLKYLCCRARKTRADVTVPKSRERRLNPVCAVYRRRALRAIQASLKAGNRKLTGFYSHVRCQVIPWREIAREGFPASIFDNMNTPREYIRARKYLKSISQE